MIPRLKSPEFLSRQWEGVLRDGLERYEKRTVQAYLHRPQSGLFDLEQDPDAVVNLAQQAEYASLLDEFCHKLRDFQHETREPLATQMGV